MSRTFTLTATSDREYTDMDVAYWVITAFEGGSSYWCNKAEAVKRDQDGKWVRILGDDYDQWLCEDGVSPYANPLFWENGARGYRMWDEYEEKWCDHVLTLSSIQKALKYQPPKHQGQSRNWFRKTVDSLITEDYDAGDADTLVQVAVFGELVYG